MEADKALPRWTIQCCVVDNFGDAGVLWRLARRLAAAGQRRVTLRIDAIQALTALVPGAALGATVGGVRIEPWDWRADDPLPDVLITGFDARPPESLRQRMRPGCPLWITVDHLSAEQWVESVHLSPSPKGDGCIEHYFYPGFTAATGGLLLEPGILAARDRARIERQARPDASPSNSESPLTGSRSDVTRASLPARPPASGSAPAATCLLFCYRPSPLLTLARALRRSAELMSSDHLSSQHLPSQHLRSHHPPPHDRFRAPAWTIIVPQADKPRLAPGIGAQSSSPHGHGGAVANPEMNVDSPAPAPRRAHQAVEDVAPSRTRVRIERQAFVPQDDFDALLVGNRLNLVRGEDSLVRAIWAARPFVWQAWRQPLATRSAKVEALLARQAEWLAPADQAALALLTRWWNGLPQAAVSGRGAADDVRDPALAAVAAALAAVMTHQERIEAGLVAWGDALSRRELATELIRFAVGLSGRPL